MKTALITGISRGIGKALAEKFLAENYFVIGTSTSGSANITNENLVVFQLDLANFESIESCADKILNLKKPIDIFINNSGVYLKDDPDHTKNMAVFRKVLEINLIGPIDFTKRLTHMFNPDAHVINISSRQGSLSYPPGACNLSYKISKAGLNMFTRVLSHDLKEKTTVSSVHPGAVMTEMAMADADMTPEEAAEYIYNLAISKPESGQFWFKGEPFPW